MSDPVNHPRHYNSHPSGVEAITITEHYNFNIGNTLKYCWRSGLKDGQSDVQDLKKARWYLDREIQRLEKEAMEAEVISATFPSTEPTYNPPLPECRHITCRRASVGEHGYCRQHQSLGFFAICKVDGCTEPVKNRGDVCLDHEAPAPNVMGDSRPAKERPSQIHWYCKHGNCPNEATEPQGFCLVHQPSPTPSPEIPSMPAPDPDHQRRPVPRQS